LKGGGGVNVLEGGGVNVLEGGGVNTVKTLKFENGRGCMTPSCFGGATPGPISNPPTLI